MLDLLPISQPRNLAKTFLVADYIEILCLCNLDKRLSLNDALVNIYHSVKIEAEKEISEQETGEELSTAEFNDRQIENAEDWFRQLRFRERAFRDYYPFSIKDDDLILKEEITNKMKIYIFLLMCSSLRFVKGTSRNKVADYFETFAVKVMENYLPAFEVHPFGKSTRAREFYPARLFDAIKKLCQNLNEQMICSLEEVGNRNTGDGGLDIVAWRLLGDYETPGNLICFAQCACRPEWEEKLYDIDIQKWIRRIKFINPPVKIILIPICFRNADGAWVSTWNISSAVIIDRLRICLLLDSAKEQEYDFFPAVNDFLNIINENCS